MTSEFERKLVRLDVAKHRVIERIEAIDPGRYNEEPAPGRWSIAQTLEHVIKAEAGSVSYMKKKVNDPESLPRTGWKQSLLNGLVMLALRTRLRFRAPAVVATMSDDGSVEVLLDSWEEVREDLEEIVADFPAELEDRCVFRHPISGRMTMAETLSFLVHHLEHHEVQFDRIIEALNGR